MTDTARPLVTFALFAYNQEKYIREAVEGAFSQTYEPLEIILSDDFSSDRTFEIMQEMAAAYDGPHEVRVRQSEVNRGVLSHVLSVSQKAKGVIFVVGAGDDISLTDRVEIIVSSFVGDDVFALSSDDIIIDEHGLETEWDTGRSDRRDGWHEKSAAWVHGATAAYRTNFLKALPIPENPVFYEDMVFSDLINALGKKSIRCRLPLIKYRHHLHNLSNRLVSDDSPQTVEEKFIERCQRSSVAKNYSAGATATLTKINHRVNADALSHILGEYKYFSLISSWQQNSLIEKIQLIYFSYRYGSIKSGLVRVLGKNVFFKLKSYQ